MKKKPIIIVILLILLIAAGLFYFYKFTQKPTHLTEMKGSVIEVKSNSVVIEGSVGADITPTKKIEFRFNPSTIYNRHRVVITQDQMTSGKSFHPETKIEKGSFSDLEKGVKVSTVTSPDDLQSVSNAQAYSIDYYTYDLPNVSQ